MPALAFPLGSQGVLGDSFNYPPEVVNFVPSLGSPITPLTVIQFDVTDDKNALLRVIVDVSLENGKREVVYNGSAFQRRYAPCRIEPLPNGKRFFLRRAGGWSGNVQVNVFAIDTVGLEDNGGPRVIRIGNVAPGPTTFNPNGGTIGPETPLIVTVVDDSGVFRRVYTFVSYPSLPAEVVHDGSVFAPLYARSSRGAITGGFTYTVLRKGGWPESPTLTVIAIDQQGLEN